MDVRLFDFDLPPELIALRPAKPRDSARMLVVMPDGTFEHARIADLPRFLRRGDVIVVNDTKVLRARFYAQRLARPGEANVTPKIEVTLHKRVAPDRFLAFAKPVRKIVSGDRLKLGTGLLATVLALGVGGEIELGFELSGALLDETIESEGEIPLPPYIAGKRKPDALDTDDYQTVFAVRPGSVAAPTAGLHFTPNLFAQLGSMGVARETATLHVGAGTFRPVTAADTLEHRMSSEKAELGSDAAERLNAARARGGRIIATGSTSLRTLEAAADEKGQLQAFAGETELFITPGYRFKTAEVLLTNFHLPRSTLFMLVSAFCGLELIKAAYQVAIREKYRFYSYGDACLLFRPNSNQD